MAVIRNKLLRDFKCKFCIQFWCVIFTSLYFVKDQKNSWLRVGPQVKKIQPFRF